MIPGSILEAKTFFPKQVIVVGKGIGWEAGEAGWATVPPHHPPRGSGTVSANSPGSPGLRKQGLGPWQEERVPERGGWSAHQHGAGPASLSRQPAVVEVGKGTNTCVHTRVHPGSACLALVPSFAYCFRPRLTRGGGQGQGCKSP